MAIEDRSKVVAGVTLVARFKKQDYSCAVLPADAGKLSFVLEDGRVFGSPSAAGTAVIGTACNGWRFWSIADGPVKAVTEPSTATTAAKAPRKRTPRATPPEGTTPPKAREVKAAAKRPPMPKDGKQYFWNKDGWVPKSQRPAKANLDALGAEIAAAFNEDAFDQSVADAAVMAGLAAGQVAV